jgi:hypothetical protein
MISLILMILAMLLFGIAAFVNAPPNEPLRGKLLCFGLACMAAAEVFARYPGAK